MWEEIRRNHRRSWVLIGTMGALLVVLGFLVGMTFDAGAGGVLGAIAACIVWCVLFLLALYQGDSLLLLSSKAQRVEKADAPRLWNVVEEMTIAAGLGAKMPKVYIIDDDSPNAFAVGRSPERAAVAVTSGLLKRLNRDELQGVIAHEIGHIKNLDIRFMTIASVMVGSIVLLSDFFWRSLLYGGVSRRTSSSKGGGQAQVILMIAAIAVAILAPIAAQALYFACSRRREYLADASAARFTRYPEGLASALEKITVLARGSRGANRALAPLFIVSPLSGMAASGLFSTHPPSELRIKILRSMSGRAGYVDYEAAFKRLASHEGRMIGVRTLASEGSVAAREPSVEEEPKRDALERVREVAGVLDRVAGFIPLICACGVHIKVPPGLDRERVPCPRCGRSHDVPHAEPAAAASSGAAEAPAPPMQYRRQGEGWESFKCSCGKVLQLAPNFIAPSITCRKCKRKVEIVAAEETPAPSAEKAAP